MKTYPRLLALTAAVALSIAGCSGNTSTPASPSASGPTESASAGGDASASPEQGASPASEVSEGVTAGLKYNGTELEVVPSERVKSYLEAYGKQLSALRTIKSDPAECAAHNTEVNLALVEGKNPKMAGAKVGKETVSVQVFGGAAKEIDFAQLRDIIAKCSSYTFEVNGRTSSVKLSEVKTSISADQVIAQQVEQVIGGQTQNVVTILAEKADHLVVTSTGGVEPVDVAKLDELTVTVLSRL